MNKSSSAVRGAGYRVMRWWTDLPKKRRDEIREFTIPAANYLFTSFLITVPAFITMSLWLPATPDRLFLTWVALLFTLPAYEHYYEWHRAGWRDGPADQKR